MSKIDDVDCGYYFTLSKSLFEKLIHTPCNIISSKVTLSVCKTGAGGTAGYMECLIIYIDKRRNNISIIIHRFSIRSNTPIAYWRPWLHKIMGTYELEIALFYRNRQKNCSIKGLLSR